MWHGTVGLACLQRRNGKENYILTTIVGGFKGVGVRLWITGKIRYFDGPIPACFAYLVMGTVLYAVLSYHSVTRFNKRCHTEKWLEVLRLEFAGNLILEKTGWKPLTSVCGKTRNWTSEEGIFKWRWTLDFGCAGEPPLFWEDWWYCNVLI